MIPLTIRQARALQDASKDRLSLASKIDYAFSIAGKDYTHLIKELRITPQDGRAVVLEGTIGARLSESLEREQCRLDYIIGGERITGYLGQVMWLKVDGGRTGFLAATPGYRMGETPMGDSSEDDLSYISAVPSEAMYEVASRMSGYSGIEIPRVNSPLFTRAGGERFKWTLYVSEALEEIEGESDLILEDTPLGAAKGRIEGAVVGDASPEWVFEEGRDFDNRALSVSTTTEGRYARVVVWRKLADDSHEKLAERGVDNGKKNVDPASTLFIEHTDTSPDSAHQTARNAALELADNEKVLEFPSVYPPFWLTRGDPILVRGREVVDGGTIVREYRSRLVSVSSDAQKKRGALKAVGLQSREFFEPRVGGEVFRGADAFRALYGRDFLYRSYVSTDLSWASYDASTGEGILDVRRAALEGVTIYYDERTDEIVVQA